VLADLDRREPDSAQFIRPQRHHADVVISFREGAAGDGSSLDAELQLRDTLPHPDLSQVIGDDDRGITMTESDSEVVVNIAGNIDPTQAAEIEELVWERLHFASHLRSDRLGQFTIGNDLQRSESLALVQLLILYHLVTAKAAVALGGEGPRADAAEVAEKAEAVASP
jgi:phosphoribulokinase